MLFKKFFSTFYFYIVLIFTQQLCYNVSKKREFDLQINSHKMAVILSTNKTIDKKSSHNPYRKIMLDFLYSF